MVRCSNCKKSFKQHSGACWNDGLCYKCWIKARDMKYTPTAQNTRLTSTPIDFLLDQYVQREVLKIDN